MPCPYDYDEDLSEGDGQHLGGPGCVDCPNESCPHRRESPPCQWTHSKQNVTHACDQPAARFLQERGEEWFLCDRHRRFMVGAMVREWKREIVQKVFMEGLI